MLSKQNTISATIAEYGAILLVLIGCTYIFYAIPGAAEIFTNADSIQLPTMFSDLKENPANFFGWNLPEAPYYFPDMVVFFAINFLVKQPILAIQIYGAVQFFILFLATRWLFLELGGKHGWVHTLTFSTGSLFITIACAFLMNHSPLITHSWSFLLSYIHFGTYIFSLICLAFCLRFWQTSKIVWLILINIAVFLTTFSDLLFILYFVIPFLTISFVAIALKIFQFRQVYISSISVAVSSLLAYIINQNENINTLSHTTDKVNIDFFTAYSLFFQFLKEVYQVATVKNYYFIFFCIIFPFCYILLKTFFPLKFLIKRKNKNIIQKQLAETFKFFLTSNNIFQNRIQTLRWLWTKVFVAVAVLITVVAVFATGRYIDLGSIRYFHPLTYCATFLILSLSLRIEETANKSSQFVRALVIGMIAAILIVFVSLIGKPLEQLFPVPSYIGCFNNLGNVAGLAEYWFSKPLILFSNRQVQVATITPDGHPYYWANNNYWYTDSWANPGHPPKFQFIFMRSLEPKAIEQKYGSPNRVVPCNGSEIWFYDRPDILYKKLLDVNL